jgi:NADH-dependant formate dehydrogenase delta subunit FdsD
MHAELLVRMINQIADFYGSGSEPDVAAQETLTHVQRMWAHRMRRQMVEIGAADPGLGPIARRAVELLVATDAPSRAAG